MARGSENQAIRQIRTLYATGTLGGQSDAQLVDRFLARGPEAEDAFAALVHRHGPMVLGVCRRMLPGSDADDAFQAVFLVLARRVGSIRRLDGLRPWLYGVAVRTSKEARRRTARRLAREGEAMDETRLKAAPDAERGDLLARLDEEMERLPSRFRAVLVLCELEGMPRAEAASQLGLPEGTVSSRLARGRTLLRERLARRGLTLGFGSLAALATKASAAIVTASLADSTVRHAFTFATGAGTRAIPATVASLAEGVLKMMSVARLKLTMVAAIALTTASVTAGVLWASVLSRPAPIPALNNPGDAPGQVQVRGIVVDEAGRPVAGAEVVVSPFTWSEARGVSDGRGEFAIPVRRSEVDGLPLLARDVADGRLGLFRYDYYWEKKANVDAPARIVLKPPHMVNASVYGSRKLHLSDAAVEVIAAQGTVALGTTDGFGTATLAVPADARVQWIIGLKSGQGFDYLEYGKVDEYRLTWDGTLAADLPAKVLLILDNARQAKIRAVDASGKALAGVRFSPWMLGRGDRRSDVNLPGSRTVSATTDADGVATFDWLPPARGSLIFWPQGEGFANRRVVLDEWESGPVTAKLSRTTTIRGRVVHPDGTPAPGILINATGTGVGNDHGQSYIRTSTNGSYEMTVSPGEAYAVFVVDDNWAAPSRMGVIVREGQPASGVDFTLGRGTLIRGTVTVGPGGKPAPGEFIRLIENAGRAPAEVVEPGDRTAREIQRQFGVNTDAQGRFSIRASSGHYTIVGPPRTGDEKIRVTDETELVRDYRMPRPEKGPISGRVVLAADPSRSVPGASVEMVSAHFPGIPFTVRADASGRFHAERPLDELYLCAKSPDGMLGALVQAGKDDTEIIIAVSPTATATGLLLDESGKPAANQELSWGRRVIVDEERQMSMNCFVPKVVTDAKGRFNLPELVVGEEYNVSIEKGGQYKMAALVRPERPGPIDLGTIQAGWYRPSAREIAEENSSFYPSALGAGKLAPAFEATTLDGRPLKLEDFRGKYVLLDFWATWCGPCIAEIPQLQAVHDSFGRDDRFAILSLSVDEKVDEPRRFQEKRKLPWSQAFLGTGIQGPVPASFGVRAIPAFVLIGPDGKIVARGMRGKDIKKEVARALGKTP